MATSFFGLYVQRDALQIAQKALDITGNNITNIKTEGYSRQRLDIVSVANTKGTLGYNNKISLAGRGADTLGVTQVRDKLLDTKVRKYSAELCETGAKTTILGDIEDVVDEIENQDSGLTAIFRNFKESFQSFSATGADRQDLSIISRNKADSVINVLKNYDLRFNDIEIATREDIETTTGDVNKILRDIASLNKQIEDSYVQMDDVYATPADYKAEIEYGPLELKDKLNLLCDELSQYLPISVKQEQKGTYTVSLVSDGTEDRVLVRNEKYAKVDWQFSDEQPARDDFAEFYVSSLNSEKGWDKSLREITDEIKTKSAGQPDDQNLEKLMKKLNELIYDGRVEEAFKLERDEIMPLASGSPYNVEYNPIFTENMTPAQLAEAPTYAISIKDISDDFNDGTIKGGSIKGLFDMYNGKGCYANSNENGYRGIKYYQETIRAFANTMVKDFNAIYDDYNTKNGDNFKLFEFSDLDGDGYPDNTVESLQVADSWSENTLRCVHPKVDSSGNLDYNYDELDNEYLNKILSVFEGERDFGAEPENYSFENFITHYGNTVGSDLEYELGSFESTNIMFTSVSEAREEVMGVSMDEEGVNMMNYQKWYNAISRMINTLDECLDKLINNTGMVGR